MIREYYWLTKPGIIYGNAITTIAGFFFASKGNVDWLLLFGVLIGISLVIGSACVFNNYIDRDIDQQMARTKNRALVTGAVSKQNAIIFATVLGILGFLTLHFYTNPLTLVIGFTGFAVYIALYSPLKRRTVYATLIGSISGATPILAGYTAVTNSFDTIAIILFLILVFWQMPHFYAIAIRRMDEYKAASIPVLPIQTGMSLTKIAMLGFIIAFTASTFTLTFLGYTGFVYQAVVTLLAVAWLWLCLMGFVAKDDKLWARQMFLFSLIVLLVFSVLISIPGV